MVTLLLLALAVTSSLAKHVNTGHVTPPSTTNKPQENSEVIQNSDRHFLDERNSESSDNNDVISLNNGGSVVFAKKSSDEIVKLDYKREYFDRGRRFLKKIYKKSFNIGGIQQEDSNTIKRKYFIDVIDKLIDKDVNARELHTRSKAVIQSINEASQIVSDETIKQFSKQRRCIIPSNVFDKLAKAGVGNAAELKETNEGPKTLVESIDGVPDFDEAIKEKRSKQRRNLISGSVFDKSAKKDVENAAELNETNEGSKTLVKSITEVRSIADTFKQKHSKQGGNLISGNIFNILATEDVDKAAKLYKTNDDPKIFCKFINGVLRKINPEETIQDGRFKRSKQLISASVFNKLNNKDANKAIELNKTINRPKIFGRSINVNAVNKTIKEGLSKQSSQLNSGNIFDRLINKDANNITEFRQMIVRPVFIKSVDISEVLKGDPGDTIKRKYSKPSRESTLTNIFDELTNKDANKAGELNKMIDKPKSSLKSINIIAVLLKGDPAESKHFKPRGGLILANVFDKFNSKSAKNIAELNDFNKKHEEVKMTNDIFKIPTSVKKIDVSGTKWSIKDDVIVNPGNEGANRPIKSFRMSNSNDTTNKTYNVNVFINNNIKTNTTNNIILTSIFNIKVGHSDLPNHNTTDVIKNITVVPVITKENRTVSSSNAVRYYIVNGGLKNDSAAFSNFFLLKVRSYLNSTITDLNKTPNVSASEEVNNALLQERHNNTCVRVITGNKEDNFNGAVKIPSGEKGKVLVLRTNMTVTQNNSSGDINVAKLNCASKNASQVNEIGQRLIRNKRSAINNDIRTLTGLRGRVFNNNFTTIHERNSRILHSLRNVNSNARNLFETHVKNLNSSVLLEKATSTKDPTVEHQNISFNSNVHQNVISSQDMLSEGGERHSRNDFGLNSLLKSGMKMKFDKTRLIQILLIPALVLSGLMPYILPMIKSAVMVVGTMTNMAFMSALMTLIRGYIFDARPKKEYVIYYNQGYKNEKLKKIHRYPIHR